MRQTRRQNDDVATAAEHSRRVLVARVVVSSQDSFDYTFRILA